MKTTIFYFHGGNSYYLPFSIGQAIQYNADADIIFLGDSTTAYIPQKYPIKHVNFEQYFEESGKFETLYEHMSPNSYFTELKCFQRWITLAEYCEKNAVEGRIVLLDSDVLLYCSLAEFMDQYFRNYDIAVCGEYGPGYIMFRDRSVCCGLADTIMSYYSDPEKKKKLQADWDILSKQTTGDCAISDMKLIDRYIRESGIRKLDLCEVVDGKCFDNHLGKIDARFPLDPKTGNKTIIMKNGIPWCYNVMSKELVQYRSIHFQGARKEIMYEYYTGDPKYVPCRAASIGRKVLQRAKHLVRRYIIKKK